MGNLPYSAGAEKSVIGAILQTEEDINYIFNLLKTSMFFDESNKEIFKSILTLYKRGIKVDTITVLNNLKERSVEVSESYLYECLESALGTSSLKSHTGIVIEYYIKRTLLIQADELREKVQTGEKTGIEVAKEMGEKLYNIISFHTPVQVVSGENIVEYVKVMLEEKKTLEYVRTGYSNLDAKLVAGFPLSNVSVMSGCPGNLKSTFRSNLELRMCERKIGVISIAVEQDMQTEIDRKLAYMSHIPFPKIQQGKHLTEEELLNLKRSTELIEEEYNLHVIADRGMNIALMRNKINFIMTRVSGIKVIFVDLFSYLEDVMSEINTPQLIAQAMREINKMSQEFNVHFCLLSHIRRDSQKKKKDIRPKFWEIKGSGAYEEVARLIFLLHRPKLYNKAEVEDYLEVNIAKQSGGAAGDMVNVFFDFDYNYYKLTERAEVEGYYYD